MTDLTAKFAAFEAQAASEHTAVMGALANLQAALDLVASNTDLALENNAANTKALLAAIGQSAACFPCPTPTIVVPPIDTTTNPIDEEHCKRSQWIVATIHRLLDNFDTLQSFNVVGTFGVLNDAIAEIVAAIAAGDTIPLPSFPETIQLVGTYVSYAGERAFSGVGLITQFAPLEDALISAIYASGDAASAKAAYNAVIDGSGVSTAAGFLFKAVAYNALWSYALDPATDPDLSAFDGAVCSFPSGTCFTLDLHTTSIVGGGATVDAVTEAFGPFTPVATVNSSSGSVTWDLPSWFGANVGGWTMEVLIGSAIMYYRAGGIGDSGLFSDTGVFGVDGTPHTLPSCGTFHIRGATGGRVRICST